MLLARPFSIGDTIRLKSGPLGGELRGEVVGMGLTYVDMLTDDGPLFLPNSAVLAAAIGPAARPEPETLSLPGQAGYSVREKSRIDA